MLKVSLTILISLSLTVLSASGVPQSNRAPQTPAGISQLVENRSGHTSCWGVVIQLGSLRFKRSIAAHQIKISEAKHGSDLREIMTWQVDQNGRRLVIRFKPGMGDFGSGNRVEVKIGRSAFVTPIPSGNSYFTWVIDTDVL